MSLEREVKEALARRAEDVRPQPAAWDRVERKIVRVRRRRLAGAVLGVAAAVAAVAVAVPALLSQTTPGGGFATNLPEPEPTGSPSVSEAPPPAPPPGRRYFFHAREGYQVLYPEAWAVSEFEAHTEFRPPGFPGLAGGEETFGVDLFLLGERYDDQGDTPVGSDGPYRESSGEIGGRKYVSWETEGYSGRGWHHLHYRIDWPECPGTGCVDAPVTMVANVYAGSRDLWERFGETGREVLESVRVASEAEPAGVVTTRRGSVADGVAWDHLTRTLVAFMDARIEQDDMTAQALLSRRAKRELARTLFGSGEPPRPWVFYEIRTRTETADGAARFEVFVAAEELQEGHATSGTVEHIAVGTDGETEGSPTLVLSAETVEYQE